MDAFLFAQERHAYVWGEETHYLPPAGSGLAADAPPVLIKRISADTALSVQVHPDDRCAARHGYERGKTEAWLTDACAAGAYLYLGLRADETPASLARAVTEQTLPSLLNRVPVRAGEAYFVPAGRIHAIGAGVSLYEVQQNIALTYRLYDYGRLDQAGRPRELHVARALEAAELSAVRALPVLPGRDEAGEGYTKRARVSCGYFSVDELFVPKSARLARSGGDFEAILLTRGDAVFSTASCALPLSAGSCAYVAAGCACYTLSAADGGCACLRVTARGAASD